MCERRLCEQINESSNAGYIALRRMFAILHAYISLMHFEAFSQERQWCERNWDKLEGKCCTSNIMVSSSVVFPSFKRKRKLPINKTGKYFTRRCGSDPSPGCPSQWITLFIQEPPPPPGKTTTILDTWDPFFPPEWSRDKGTRMSQEGKWVSPIVQRFRIRYGLLER